MSPGLERVVLDSSALLGANSPSIVAGAALGYYRAFWSPWIIAEYVRNRVEWTAERAVRDGADRAETARRLEDTRTAVNSAISYLSRVLGSVDYNAAPPVDLSWLADEDDHPIMQPALAAGADTLVTNDSTDFPSGEERNGVLFLDRATFLAALYTALPQVEAEVSEYLTGRP
jgi:hypothetical protein